MKPLGYLLGWWATEAYLPFSALGRRWRAFRSGGRRQPHLQPTSLPAVSWKKITSRRLIRLVESQKKNGNVRLSELGVLAQLARKCRNGSTLFEIGTFDGRTTLNLALNSPAQCRVVTLDLPEHLPTKFPLAKGERHFTRKSLSGERYRKRTGQEPASVSKIEQLLGDSALYLPDEHRASCSLVFVDGSHAYDYVVSDSHLARELVEPGGVIVWHDYGVWGDVTRALEDLAQSWREPLWHIRGTSLVVLRNGLSP